MEEFARKYAKTRLLRQLNRCQIYLQAITLADITDLTGQNICPRAQKGERHPHRKTNYMWPNQEKINAKYWTIWTTCVKDTFCGTDSPQLKKPLGQWHPNADSQIWETYVEPKTGNLIKIKEVDGQTRFMSYRAHPMKNHIVYTKGRCQEIPCPETMYQISMHSESLKSWVFTKPGNSNIRLGAEHSPEFLINQNEPATDPLTREQTT